MKIENKVIVITGGTKGLGKALSELLSTKNTVIIAARVVARGMDKNIISFKTNVTEEAEVKKLANHVINRFGRIDIWFNNAGIWIPHSPIEKVDFKKAHELLEVNYFGLFYGSKYAMQQMRKQKNGVIVNIISSSALDGGIGSSAYCASKFAASGFTKCLRHETVKNHIKVISVYTRGIKTDLFHLKKPKVYEKFMEPKYVAEKIIKHIRQTHPSDDLIIHR
jgi:NAD(P)-dependent dehydrogenase (short-subunit alcohol dehydrogenase family)